MKQLIVFVGENNNEAKSVNLNACVYHDLDPDDYKVHACVIPELNLPDNTTVADMDRSQSYNLIKAGINSIDLHYLDQYMDLNEDCDSLNREYIAESILMVPACCAFAIVCNGLCDRV